MIRILFAAICIFLLPDHQDTAQQQSIRVRYVVTDLSVRDAAGEFVSGLKPEDLVLEIDGRATPIRSLDEFSLLTRDSLAVRQYLEELSVSRDQGETPPPPPSQPRLFLFVIDTGSLGPNSFIESKKTLRQMVEGLVLPYDSVVILTYHDSFSVVAGPTTHAEKAVATFEAMPAPGGLGKSMINTLDIPINPLKANDSSDAASARMRAGLAARRYVESFDGLARSIRSFPGKKSIILFSDGPNISDLQRFVSFGSSVAQPRDSGGAENPQMEHVRAAAEFNQYLQAMAKSLNSSSISVYSVRRGAMEPEWVQILVTELQSGVGLPDTSSIYGLVKSMETERVGTMQVMAENTHGAFYDAGLPTESLVANLQERTGVYYLLGFSAPADGTGRYHNLRVTAKRPGLRVVHRDGFFSEKSFASMTDAERTIHLEEGFYMVPQPDELGLEVRTRVVPVVGGPPLALISLSIDPRRLGRGEMNSRSLEAVVNVEGGGKEIVFRRHWVRIAPGELAPGGLRWLNLLAPLNNDGPSSVHVALRDGGSYNRSARSTVLEPPSQTGAVVRSATLLCSPDLEGNLSVWPVDTQPDEKGGSDIPIPFNFRLLGDGELPPGGTVIGVVIIGGLTEDLFIPGASAEVMALYEPNTAEQLELTVSDSEWTFDAERRLLWVKTRLDLGGLPKASGRIGIVVRGLIENRPLATATSFAFGK